MHEANFGIEPKTNIEMLPSPQSLQKRLKISSVIFFILWLVQIAPIVNGGPFWAIFFNAAAGVYFALRDRREIALLARTNLMPQHPNGDVQELIDGTIEISEYVKRTEKK